MIWIYIDSDFDLYEFINVYQEEMDKWSFGNVSYLFVPQQSIKASTIRLFENTCTTYCA